MKLGTLELIHAELLRRFGGWYQNFCGEAADPDPALLPSAPGQLLQLEDPTWVLSTEQLVVVARAWERSDCFIWAARSHRLHRDWDPLVQSFASFEAADPQCASYTLGLDPIEPLAGVQQILGFMLMQALAQATPCPCSQPAAAAAT